MLKHVSHCVSLGVVFFASTAWAAGFWNYHPDYDGFLTVHGTIDCVSIDPALFEGDVEECHYYFGDLPPWANDYQITFVADPPGCENRNEQYKVAIAVWNPGLDQWELQPFGEWLDTNLCGSHTYLPVIADMRIDGVQTIYSVVDLATWVAAPGRLQDTYDITNGTCPDLPGFLIGTTLITFDPEAGSGENPFQTTPLTGPVNMVGDVLLAGCREPPAVSEWGMVVLVLLLLTAVTIVVGRRRRAANG